MFCIYTRGNDTYEFDAENKAEETKKIRDICKERGWKIKDMKRVIHE